MTTLAPAPIRAGGARVLLERNLMVYRRTWLLLASGFFEPVFYLLSLGYGMKSFVGGVTVGGRLFDYASFIAPGLIAASAMNGAVFEGINVFFKLRYIGTYEPIVTTPVEPSDVAIGEMAWSLVRGLLYAAAFIALIAALGLVHSWWAILSLPAAALVGFAFAGLATAGATFMRTWKDFELVTLVQLPLFLFATTFYPLSVYPEAVQWFVRLTPLYSAVELMRGLTLGTIGWTALAYVAYLAALGAVGTAVGTRRIRRSLFR